VAAREEDIVRNSVPDARSLPRQVSGSHSSRRG
jgi:hypothetical protein